MFDYLKVENIWKEKNFNDDTAENTIPLYIIVPSFLKQSVAGFNYTHSASRCMIDKGKTNRNRHQNLAKIWLLQKNYYL